jgi:hypothetical protein
VHTRELGYTTVTLLAALAFHGGIAEAAEPQASRPLRGLLIDSKSATPSVIQSWKADGGNAIVVVLDESAPRERWSGIAKDCATAGVELYVWIEVARNPALADAHPEWMATPGGHHDDWRKRFPNAPTPKPGETVKQWPWVPIGYEPAFEAHRQRIVTLLDALPPSWSGVFLNDLQAGPSSCGCGNDQCRWALDYGTKPTAPKTKGDDTAAHLITDMIKRYPNKGVIPVWVTECEKIDLPGAAGGTGYCGTVECAARSCWPSYERAWNPLLQSTPGPVAVALWSESFRRGQDWPETGLKLFLQPPGGTALAPERAIAILPDKGESSKGLSDLTSRLKQAGRGWVLTRTPIDQSWQPRLVMEPR